MKILSIAVPCYNSAEYMENCINSLLKGGEDVEIIIVNDGSFKDNTAEIADAYAEKYPTIVKAVHQENGGHGQAVNTGLKNATGMYFKVVDSDDWVDAAAYEKILATLKRLISEDKAPDMLLSNYVYDKVGVKNKKVMKYVGAIPENKSVTWEDGIKLNKSQYILMHSVIYKVEVLKECELELPKHTFYVDNIFVFKPLASVKSIYYLNVDFYRYYIGREDQSVNEKVMIGRVDQQIRITKIMIEDYLNMKVKSKKLDKYLLQYLDMMMCICSILLILEGSKESLSKKKQVWQYLKERDERLYKKLRTSVFGIGMNLPTGVGRFISKTGYKIAQKVFGFN
ncbi:MAG: glycosyltransferase [Lachnospiraceae bacterium]|nr:glycosyltransferase [Lachnospiraceae bacterium]